jgi:hypothetical protein
VSSDISLNANRTDSCFDEDLTVIEVTTRSCAGVQDRALNGSSTAPVPDNMLYNIGLDSAATDLVCLSPSNAIFRPSDALMFENQLKREGTMKKGGDELPTALVVPLYYSLQGGEPSAWVTDSNRTVDPGRSASVAGVNQRGGVSAPLSQDKDAEINASSSHEALSSVHYFPYPSRASNRASQQSKRLQKPFRTASSRPYSTQDLHEIPFNAQVWKP